MSMSQDKPKTANSKSPPSDNKQKSRKPRVPRKITESYLHNSGLYYLQRYTSSVENFRRVMMRKIDKSCRHHTEQDQTACAEMLGRVVDKFIELGLLDDSGYTRGMVTSLRRRGLSTRAIHAKLQAKGLKAENITAQIAEFDEENGRENKSEAELHAALVFCRRKRFLPFYDGKNPEKSLAALGRAGFSYDIARKALETDIEDAEEFIARSLA